MKRNWNEIRRVVCDIVLFVGVMLMVGIILLLSGCARHGDDIMPEQTIVSSGIAAANETLNWATNNLPDTADVRVLTGQIASCRDSLSACGDACASAREKYRAELSAARTKTNMWRVIAAVFVAILAAIGVKRIIK